MDQFAARTIRDLPADVISRELGINIATLDSMVARTVSSAVHGFLADIPVDKVVEFQDSFLKFMRTAHPEVSKKIIEQKKLDDALEGEIQAAIKEFKETIPYKMA